MTVYAGQVLTADIINAVLATTQQLVVVKPSNESVTSSTALQNDDHLLLPVAANTRYLVDSLIKYTGDLTGDLNLGWSGPSGATFDWYSDAYWESGADAGKVERQVRPIGGTMVCGCSGASVTLALPVRGHLLVGGTAGTLQMRWAQVTSFSTATTVFAGSLLRATRLA